MSVRVLPALSDPGALAALDERTPVVLVARAGALSRRELTRAVEALRAAAVPCAGLVLQGLRPDAA
jgi:dethiobiotin synthetase